MTELNQAVVVLTGASGGFGQQFTRQLLQAGSHLILTDLDKTRLQQQVAPLQEDITTGKVLACWGIDLSHPQGSQTLYDAVQTLHQPVDLLINNAGIGLYGRMDEVPPEQWETLMQVNLLAPMRLSTLFMADMIQRRKGHIVNISSLAGWIALAGMAHYGSSKYGLRGFTEGLYQEVKAYNIKVTGVYPFFSRTPLLQSKRYGSLAEEIGDIESMASDPALIIQRTLNAIVQEKLHVFPDRTAQLFALLKRYVPSLVYWGTEYFKPRK
ncbi:SDR family NAD(P)-dependent oxidoreductase [Spirulina sp. CS-785/01]|uniref:SDR family NAD(P)-dependent oxidoreductase n=1 Tax=Spirulina sp. CS-785/01 TaxID=3021716 RepID=UPI00232C9364|nr:SDR family NAD(P)-dependent oxidoreductase [Spirulina sp. CS-785/01]MDB9314684.1 SDR family NAD(P)-dependent oxidoreductase [Spirulina sp. CS-785/01]